MVAHVGGPLALAEAAVAVADHDDVRAVRLDAHVGLRDVPQLVVTDAEAGPQIGHLDGGRVAVAHARESSRCAELCQT